MIYLYTNRKLFNNKKLKMLSIYLLKWYVLFSNTEKWIEVGKR